MSEPSTARSLLRYAVGWDLSERNDDTMSEPCGHNSYWTTAYQNCVMCENAALKAQVEEFEQDLEQEHCEILVCTECGRTSKHGWIGVVYESTPNNAEEYDTKCPECGSTSLDEDARRVVNALDTVQAALATMTAERDTWKQKYEDGVRLWDPVYEVVLNERDHLRAQVEAQAQRIEELESVLQALPDGAETTLRQWYQERKRADMMEQQLAAMTQERDRLIAEGKS